MIKRRFYLLEHGERDSDAGSQSSSSSESESDSVVVAKGSDIEESDEVENREEEEEEEEDDDDNIGEKPLACAPSPPSSSSSGYDSEDSSGDELDPLSNSADDEGIGEELNGKKLIGTDLASNGSHEITEAKPSLPDNSARCVLKHKSVFKCKICPKIVCLNEDSLRTHLNSKRHSRSEKLLNDGRLKRILNNNGEEIVIEEDGETHAERYARTLASSQDQPKKKIGGRQRQKERQKERHKRKGSNNLTKEAGKQGRESLPKKRRKNN